MCPWSLTLQSTLPAVAYECRDNYCCIFNVEYLYQTWRSERPRPDTSPVVQDAWSLGNLLNQPKCGHSGNSQHRLTTRRVSVLAGKRDSTQGGSSIASTIQGKNSMPSFSRNTSPVAVLTEPMTPPVPMDQFWGSAQSSPVQLEGLTAPDRRLAVIDSKGLV